jgi:hypothetical protein
MRVDEAFEFQTLLMIDGEKELLDLEMVVLFVKFSVGTLYGSMADLDWKVKDFSQMEGIALIETT